MIYSVFSVSTSTDNITSVSRQHHNNFYRRRRRQYHRRQPSRASSMSSMTETSMALEVITVTLNMVCFSYFYKNFLDFSLCLGHSHFPRHFHCRPILFPRRQRHLRGQRDARRRCGVGRPSGAWRHDTSSQRHLLRKFHQRSSRGGAQRGGHQKGVSHSLLTNFMDSFL